MHFPGLQTGGSVRFCAFILVATIMVATSHAQTLMNIDFGGDAGRRKTGLAAAGLSTNDFWNVYSHYSPGFRAGMKPVADGRAAGLKFSDATESPVVVTLTNGPGVWGNATGDPMLDSYVFAPNGSNLVVTLTGLPVGRYHFYLYGWAAADVSPEQFSAFTLRSGTNDFGPLNVSSGDPYSGLPEWRGRPPFVVCRDVELLNDSPVTITVHPGPGGVAVLNGIQVLSRGTHSPVLRGRVVPEVSPGPTNLVFHSIDYQGQVGSGGARFNVSIDAESPTTNEVSAGLFEGELAVLNAELPDGWRITKKGRHLTLHAARQGRNRIEFELVTRVEREEPWDLARFRGPAAAIGTLMVEATEPGVEVELLSGVLVEGADRGSKSLRGVLRADRQVGVRWQGKATETTREALLTVDSRCTVDLTPAVIRHSMTFEFEILQAALAQVRLMMPAEHALTRLTGEQVKDWSLVQEGAGTVLVVEFLRPIEGAVRFDLVSEQSVPSLPGTVELRVPQPLDVQRELGELRLRTEDILVRIEHGNTMRQVNSSANEFASFRFSRRPAGLLLHLATIEPLLTVNTRVGARLEETRLLVNHHLELDVTRAGLYGLQFNTQPGFLVSDVQADGIEDWESAEGKLRVRFARRVLGQRRLSIQLEQPLSQLPPEIAIDPIRVAGAARETVLIGAGSTPGIQLKTALVSGAREIPVNLLPDRHEELLAFRADGGDWGLRLAVERLVPRVVAEVFNLVTIGDGLVGGSATIRFGIVNQGVQQFRARLPAHWRNVEFTGSNIRRRDRLEDVWTIALQDKVWDGYTLVITYDYSFDPHRAILDARGAHPLDVERETGTLAITRAANVAIEPDGIVEPLRPIDPSELAAVDRALISRPVLLAYRYEGSDFALNLDLTRHEELAVLDAVADRAQFTSVITGSGEMLMQAGFMVKNNERPHQRFLLPAGATLWGVAVNGEPVKADRDGDWVVLALPRSQNRDQTFAIDIKYAQRVGALGRLFPRRLTLTAPKTDVPGTYAEWVLYVPASRYVSGFGGSMGIVGGVTYGARDGWDRFCAFYGALWHEFGAHLIIGGCLVGFVIALILYGRKHGFGGVVTVVAAFAVLAILGGMLLPALSKAKSKAQRISSINNLKQIGLAARIFAGDHEGRMPDSFDAMMNELSTDKVLFDPETGQRYTYVGSGKSETDPHAILAYSPERTGGHREVVFADGSVQQLSGTQFSEAMIRDQGTVIDPGALMAQRYGVAAGPSAPQPVAPFPAGAAVAEAGPVQAPGLATAMATGIKSLQFDLPKSGRAYTFTRLLSVDEEPPTISARIMSAQVFVFARAAWELMAFVAGLLLMIVQWRRAEPRPVWLAAGAMLAGLATLDLLIAWRLLHLALILAVPGLLTIGFAWVLWRRRRFVEEDEPLSAPPALPPQVALLAVAGLWFCPMSGSAFAAAPAESDANPVSIVYAGFTGTARDQAAELEALFTLVTSATNQSVALFNHEIALESFEVVEGHASVWRDDETLGVLLPDRGTTTIKLRMLVKLLGDSSGRRLDFSIPPLLGGQLNLIVFEPDAEIEFRDALALRRHVVGDQTVIEAVLGATDRLNVGWTPRRKRAADVVATAVAHQTSLGTLSSGTLSLRSVIEWRIAQGQLQRVQVRLPDGHRLLKLSGQHLRSWDLSESDASILTIDLIGPIAPTIRLVLETERSLDPLPTAVTVSCPEVLDVMRQTGLVAVRAADDLGLAIARAGGLERIDGAEFTAAIEEGAKPVFSAWRFLRPDFDLVVQAQTLEPRVEAIQRHRVTVGLDQVDVTTELDYTISRVGVFALRLLLPADGRVESVKCVALQGWSERTDGTRRLLELTLKERVLGTLRVEVELSQTFASLPPTLHVGAVHPIDVDKLAGHVTVTAAPGVGLKTGSLEGAIEVPASTVPGTETGTAGLLAFKHLSIDRSAAVPWQIALATEQLESWVRAETVTFINVAETRVAGRTMIRYEIQNAPTRDFRIKVPAAWRNVEIAGAGVRRRDGTNDTWRVELQNKVYGEYRLTVAWEMERTPDSELVLDGPESLGVERETGGIALMTTGQLQLTASGTSDQLLRIETQELPTWAAGSASGTPVLSYRCLRSGWQLRLEVKRFEDAAVLQGLIDSARLRTVVADDGQYMTQIELSIRNSGRQSLALALPNNTRIWSAFADGRPVRPAHRDGWLLLPLDRSSAEDSPIPVEVTYVGKLKFPRRSGKLELVSPRLDLPLKDARWELFLPPDHGYARFAGTMTYESAELVPVTQDFTMAEYQRQELSKQTSFEARAVDFLQRARREMATGRFDKATQLREYRQVPIRDQHAAEELRQLEIEVNRAQSRQLIDAQHAYSFSNAARLGLEPSSPAERLTEADDAVAYTVQVAEQQVVQLQKAQVVAESRVAPLRANLPTRGLRYAFIQALQTETDRPLVIQLHARNEIQTGWFGKFLRLGFGFLILWAGAGLALRVRRDRFPRHTLAAR